MISSFHGTINFIVPQDYKLKMLFNFYSPECCTFPISLSILPINKYVSYYYMTDAGGES